MPKIQLIRRDSGIIELDAETIRFDMTRLVTVAPIPVIATRTGVDLNQTSVGISIEGVLTDDLEASGGIGSSFTIDLSRNGSKTIGSTWKEIVGTINAAAVEDVRINFSTIGQLNAGLGEDLTVILRDGGGSASVVTNSIVYVNTNGLTTSDAIADAVASAISGASVKVNTTTTAVNTILTVSQSSGVFESVSESLQSGSGFDGEKITITNKTTGEGGDTFVSVTQGAVGQDWSAQFYVSDFSGGKTSSKLTKGDKVQDLLNIANMSAGGALLNPGAALGNSINLPSSVSSFDPSKFLNISESKTVRKFIVGVRIPYDSIASSSTSSTVLRQFIIPSGLGTDHSSISNNKSYDPVTIEDGETTRPNPFLEQGVAIPAVIVAFTPQYNAGDSVYTYTLQMTVVEQLVGI